MARLEARGRSRGEAGLRKRHTTRRLLLSRNDRSGVHINAEKEEERRGGRRLDDLFCWCWWQPCRNRPWRCLITAQFADCTRTIRNQRQLHTAVDAKRGNRQQRAAQIFLLLSR